MLAKPRFSKREGIVGGSFKYFKSTKYWNVSDDTPNVLE